MATKKELNAAVIALCTQHKAPEALTKALDELTRPGKGGASVNVEDVFVAKAKDGKAYLLCSVSNLWMEATAENFYEDASENNKFGGLKRLSRAAESARKKAIGIKKATEKAVMDDLLAGNITREEANKKLETIPAPDFTVIKGLKTKPQ
jgi:hypothetical protein